MNSDEKFDLFGCVTYLITSVISLVVGVVLALRWSSEQSTLMTILIWVGCLFGSGILGYHAMLAITLPFAYYADKKARKQ